MRGRAALVGALVLAGCVQPPPAPGNLPRISTQLVCYEVRVQPPPPFGDGKPFNLYFWQWTTVDAGHVQVEDVTAQQVNSVVDIPAGGTTQWAKFAEGHIGRIVWLHDGGWTPVALFPADHPLPARCTWVVPPV